jgi:hypoxanthine phosphoribosyltransferase
MLKGVIFSLKDVLATSGQLNEALFHETIRLIRFLKSKNIKPVFASNHHWTVTNKGTGKSRPFQEWLRDHIGEVPFYIGGRGGMPFKPQAAAVQHILADQGWSRNEVMFVGNSETDMRTARNGGVLFLNALWHGESNPYGYQFDSPKDVGRFVDCLCLGLHDWFWSLQKGNLHVYALAPFTTLSPALALAHAYSADARATAKHGAGDPTFWGRLLAARVYLSRLVDEVDYIAVYPGHAPDSKQPVVAEALTILAQSLHKQYLPDLIIRHVKAQKSQTARNIGQAVGVENQLSTIKLNPAPSKGPNGRPYKNNPLKKGKTILLVDDICTAGNSFEAGRAFIQQTGAKVICLSWLKTINTNYNAIRGSISIPNPYVPYVVSKPVPIVACSYAQAIIDPRATLI